MPSSVTCSWVTGPVSLLGPAGCHDAPSTCVPSGMDETTHERSCATGADEPVQKHQDAQPTAAVVGLPSLLWWRGIRGHQVHDVEAASLHRFGDDSLGLAGLADISPMLASLDEPLRPPDDEPSAEAFRSCGVSPESVAERIDVGVGVGVGELGGSKHRPLDPQCVSQAPAMSASLGEKPPQSVFDRARYEFRRVAGSALRSIGPEDMAVHFWDEVQRTSCPGSLRSGTASGSTCSASTSSRINRVRSSGSTSGDGGNSAAPGACLRRRGIPVFSETSAKQAVALRVAQLLSEMDLTQTGRVGVHEWLHYAAMLASSRMPALWSPAMVSTPLGQAMLRQGSALEDLQCLFEPADLHGTGILDRHSIKEMYRLGLWRFGPRGPGGGAIDDELLRTQAPDDLARELIQVADLDGSGCISYGEFMAYCVGRRKVPVNIHFYDLSGGVAKAVSPCLLGKPLEGLWHTGVVVYGKEYFFGGEIFYDKPGQTAFGKPTKMLRIGWTLQRQAELHDFIVEDLRPMFNREVYDIMHRNCNHFTDIVVLWLTGHRIGVEVTSQPEQIMQLPMARLVRPLLNRWLGNIDGAETARPAEARGCVEAPLGALSGAPLPARSLGRKAALKDIAAVRLRARGMNIFDSNEDVIGCDNEALQGALPVPAKRLCGARREGWEVPGAMVTVLQAEAPGGGVWGIVCASASDEGSWVRWLDVAELPSRAQLRTEFVPRALLAPARAEIASRAGPYLAALRALLSLRGPPPGRASGGASCGWRPTMASLPRSMQARGAEVLAPSERRIQL